MERAKKKKKKKKKKRGEKIIRSKYLQFGFSTVVIDQQK
jgi:hypothetical protein